MFLLEVDQEGEQLLQVFHLAGGEGHIPLSYLLEPMPSSLRGRWLMVNDIEPLRLHLEVLYGRCMSIHSTLRPDLKQNITKTTTPVHLTVVLTLKK
jgi:hypothetical protein